jgi:hypothetical protein
MFKGVTRCLRGLCGGRWLFVVSALAVVFGALAPDATADAKRWPDYNGVVVLTSHVAFAVGDLDQGSTPFIARWDGRDWSPSLSLASYADGSFFAVTARSVSDVWALGEGQRSLDDPEEPMIEHFDGHRWHAVAPPGDGSGLRLESIAVSGGTVWVAGAQQVSPTPAWSAVIYKLTADDKTWQAQRLTFGAGVTTMLDSISVSAGAVWVVGNLRPSRTSFVLKPLVLYLSKGRWRRLDLPIGDAKQEYLTAVSVADGQEWAVGVVDTSRASRPLLVHGAGTQWSTVSVPRLGPRASLTAVSAADPHDIWATGEAERSAGSMRTVTVHCALPTTCGRVPSPNVSPSDNLNGVSTLSGHLAITVGISDPGYPALALRWNGASWTQISQ